VRRRLLRASTQQQLTRFSPSPIALTHRGNRMLPQAYAATIFSTSSYCNS
jgi:hypothetical protein